MIDTGTETMQTLARAARTVPNRAGTRGIDVSTINRWWIRGIHGIRLETILVGGIRYTSAEAMQRFFAATTAAADRCALPTRTTRQRERAIADATHTLIREGA